MKEKEKEQDLFQDVPEGEQRIQALKDNCYNSRSESMTIKRPYTAEQLVEFKDTLSTEMIKLNELEGELKIIKDDYKAKMKPFVLKKQELLKDLKLKHKESFEDVFLMDDQEAGTMCIYDSQGKFLEKRKLYPDERQVKLNSVTAKNGTND